MYDTQTQKELRRQGMMSKIAETTGINNRSKSSVAGQLVDALSDAIDDSVSFVKDGINSTFTNYAEGALLTANAYEFGVIRNVLSDFYILGRDKVARVIMSDGTPFPRYMDGQIAVAKGSKYTIGEGTVIEFLENVIPSYGKREVYVDFRVMPSSKLDITPGSKIDLSKKTQPISSGLSLEIISSVNAPLELESDESLRRRTLFAKSRTHGSSHDAISGIISGIPHVINHYIQEDSRSGMTKIFVTTKGFEESGDISLLPIIKTKVLQTLDYLAGAEHRFDVLFPELIKIKFEFAYSNTTENMALAAIRDSFLRSYAYTVVNGIELQDIQNKLEEYNLDVIISKAIIYSDQKGEIANIERKFSIPKDSFILFDIDGSSGKEV